MCVSVRILREVLVVYFLIDYFILKVQKEIVDHIYLYRDVSGDKKNVKNVKYLPLTKVSTLDPTFGSVKPSVETDVGTGVIIVSLSKNLS